MDLELLNKITTEIEPQTLVECYNILQKNPPSFRAYVKKFWYF